MNATGQAPKADLDELLAQLDELAETRSRSRAQDLRRQIEQQIVTLLKSDGEETPVVPGSGIAR